MHLMNNDGIAPILQRHNPTISPNRKEDKT
jgi:hypothetical protein